MLQNLFIVIAITLAPVLFSFSPIKKIKQPVAKKIIIPMPAGPREIVPPETVGVGKDCPFPTVKKPIRFVCPNCKLRMQTHVLYPHLPWCPKDNSVMMEEQ